MWDIYGIKEFIETDKNLVKYVSLSMIMNDVPGKRRKGIFTEAYEMMDGHHQHDLTAGIVGRVRGARPDCFNGKVTSKPET